MAKRNTKKPSAWMILHDADHNELMAIRISAVVAVHPRIRHSAEAKVHSAGGGDFELSNTGKCGATIFLPSTSIRVREKVGDVIALLGEE